MSRGNERRPIFRDDVDMQRFVRLLAIMVCRFDIRLHAYALMPNHFHMLMTALHGGLSKAMHWLNGTYSQYFNRRHTREGHLFQGRFKSVLVQDNRYFLSVSRYIHLNPVKAQIVTEPWDYTWSSCADFVGLRTPPKWLDHTPLLDFFEGNGQAGYRDFLSERFEGNPLDEAVAGAILGAEEFLGDIVSQLPEQALRNTEVSRRIELQPKCTPNQVQAAVAAVKLPTDRKARWSRDPGLGLEMYFLHECGRLTHSEIAGIHHLSREAVTRRIARTEAALEKDPRISQVAEAIVQFLEQM